MPEDPIPPTIEWYRDRVRLIDQRALPVRLRFVDCRTVAELVDAICTLAVRGAPALGAAGAFGVALAAQQGTRRDVRAAARALMAARPTAVNLEWGVERALAAYLADGASGALAEARRIATDDVARNRALGAHGAALLGEGARVLTQCNAGALACVGYGTALGVIRAAVERGRRVSVWVPETRPVLQGARLTAWELDRLAIPATLVTDNAVGSLFADGAVDVVVVGADRIAANGDVANKIGTYGIAVLARAHEVPFVVAAPVSTIDLATDTGADITIEERAAEEVTALGGRRIAPEGVAVHNPAFDVTPARLVSAIVTEVGVARRPFRRSLARHVRDGTRRPPVAPGA
ncbi:MAG TPA: S-methyl-5-thioribose-1-phosphate isomerase [Acidimicrobiia bacterium]|nr:S-methyl-5-thioribose-1-phosphate isomerase [Acidimicrobiia bacterium]